MAAFLTCSFSIPSFPVSQKEKPSAPPEAIVSTVYKTNINMYSNFSFMKLTDSSIEKLRNSITFLEASSELMVLMSEDNSDIFKI